MGENMIWRMRKYLLGKLTFRLFVLTSKRRYLFKYFTSRSFENFALVTVFSRKIKSFFPPPQEDDESIHIQDAHVHSSH